MRVRTASHTLAAATFSPADGMEACIQSVLKAAQMEDAQYDVLSQEDDINVTPDRCLGTRPLIVAVTTQLASVVAAQAVTLDALVTEVQTLKTEQQAHGRALTALARFPFTLAAAQILRAALGIEGFKETGCDQGKARVESATMISLSQLKGVDAMALATSVEQLIVRRNNKVAHQMSVQQLDACLALISDPVRNAYPFESWVIEHYHAIKDLAPEQFTH